MNTIYYPAHKGQFKYLSKCQVYLDAGRTCFIFLERTGRRHWWAIAVTILNRGSNSRCAASVSERDCASKSTILILAQKDAGNERLRRYPRSVPIEAELARRGLHLKRSGRDLVGPCPACGGTDRFAVTPAKRLWCCRQCAKGGDVIALVQHLDGGEFLDAVEHSAGERPRPDNAGESAIRSIIDRQRQEREEQDRRENDAKRATTRFGYGTKEPASGTRQRKHILPLGAARGCSRSIGMRCSRFHQRCVFGDEYLPCLLTL